jgi:hypothetical protein
MIGIILLAGREWEKAQRYDLCTNCEDSGLIYDRFDPDDADRGGNQLSEDDESRCMQRVRHNWYPLHQLRGLGLNLRHV